MAGSVHYPDVPDIHSRRQPIEADRYRSYERVSDPVVIPTRTSKTSVVLGSVLGIGAGLAIIGILRAVASGPEVTLNESPPMTLREPAFSINPGYFSALAVPAGSEVSSADEAQHASVTAPVELGSTPPTDSELQGSAPSRLDSDMYDERENVSGSDAASRDSRPIDALGRDTNLGVPDLDVGDLDVQGPGGARREEEQKQKLDMAPTETAPREDLPGVGTEPRNLPSTGDNPY